MVKQHNALLAFALAAPRQLRHVRPEYVGREQASSRTHNTCIPPSHCLNGSRTCSAAVPSGASGPKMSAGHRSPAVPVRTASVQRRMKASVNAEYISGTACRRSRAPRRCNTVLHMLMASAKRLAEPESNAATTLLCMTVLANPHGKCRWPIDSVMNTDGFGLQA